MTQGIIGIDGIYNQENYQNPYDRTSVYAEQRRVLQPHLGDFGEGIGYPVQLPPPGSGGGRGGGMRAHEQSHDIILEDLTALPAVTAHPPPPPSRPQQTPVAVVDSVATTKLDVYSYRTGGPVNDVTKIAFALILFIIAGLYVHTIILFKSNNPEWKFYLKFSMLTTFLFVLALWSLDITIADLHQ